jgi:hypothetical protein
MPERIVKYNKSMNLKTQWITVILFLLSLFLLMTSLFLFLELRASNKTLNQLNLVKPGIHISKIEEKLGKPMAVRNANEGFGTLRDDDFCNEKKLYWFYISTPPCRVIEVYTDKDDIVVYTTWNSL